MRAVDQQALEVREVNRSIIVGPNIHNVAVVVPAFPAPCSFIQVVRFDTYIPGLGSKFREIAYWDAAEWGFDDSDLTCIGAIAGAIKQVNDGESFTADTRHEDDCEWEEWS